MPVKDAILAEQQARETSFGIGSLRPFRHTVAMADQSNLNVVIAELFPTGVSTFYSARLPQSAELLPEEVAATSGMVEKRLDEFRHGRYCARAAMATLGVPAVAIPKGPDRAPIWPRNLAGSISHTGMAAAAAVTRSTSFQSIGLDLETAEALTPEIAAMVCRPDENAGGDGTHAKRLFCIKESIYKCLHPVVHSYIDFLEMEVLCDFGTQEFGAISHSASCPVELAARLNGRFTTESGYVISAAWLK